jgi:hypothetical protein
VAEQRAQRPVHLVTAVLLQDRLGSSSERTGEYGGEFKMILIEPTGDGTAA